MKTPSPSSGKPAHTPPPRANTKTAGRGNPNAPAVRKRLAALRAWLVANKVHAAIIPTGDPHIGEYPLEHWKSRAWLSGFSGSAGTLVVTRDAAALWTDGRYTLQAAEQLAGTAIEPMQASLASTPNPAKWLADRLARRQLVAVDGWQLSASASRRLADNLERYGIRCTTALDPVATLWKDRPPRPDGAAKVRSWERAAGRSARDKLADMRDEMQAGGFTHVLFSALDSIAWILNIRGADVAYTPVLAAFLLLSKDSATLFTENAAAMPAAIRRRLASAGVSFAPYEAVRDTLTGLSKRAGVRVGYDPDRTCATLANAISGCSEALSDSAEAAKGTKNRVELANIAERLVEDGAATARCLAWIDASLAAGRRITELDVVAEIERLRGESPRYRGPSFATIAAYGPHAAVVHYEPSPESDIPLRPHGLFLLDTGGQYEYATTDITRTVACGPVTKAERLHYTLVLKGHIAIARALLPKGSCGGELDLLARTPLLRHGLDYMHGTGHGVGYGLSVHEGPHSCSARGRVPLAPGMLLTNEPGYYEPGRHGIRIENMTVIEASPPVGDRALNRVRTLGCCPIDLRPADPALLTGEERDWLNDYHAWVRRMLTPLFPAAERPWLKNATRPI